MGSGISPEEVERRYGGNVDYYKREHPQHRVNLTQGFHLATTEVTVGPVAAVLPGYRLQVRC